jgi:hypothetical protein
MTNEARSSKQQAASLQQYSKTSNQQPAPLASRFAGFAPGVLFYIPNSPLRTPHRGPRLLLLLLLLLLLHCMSGF